MRVLFIGHSAGRTGAPIFLLHFLRWLKTNTDIEAWIILREGGELEQQFASVGKTWLCEGTRVYSSGKRFKKIVGKFLGLLPKSIQRRREKLLNYLMQSNFNIVYSNTITNGEILDWLSPLNIPMLTHVHEMQHWIVASGQKNLEFVKKHTFRYIAASKAVKCELSNHWNISPEKIEVVHEFIPTDVFTPSVQHPRLIRERWNIPENAFVVVGSGVETWRKGKDLFVDLALEINRLEPNNNCCFLWVGAWESRDHEVEYRSRILAEGLQNQVFFIGQVENPLDYFCSADVFAMTSREDPYPLVCLEAALMGLPILCFEGAGGMPEFVEQDAGMLFPYLDVAEMAKGILELSNSPKKKNSLGDAAKSKVKLRHDVNIGSRQLHQLILNCVGGG